MATTHVEVGLMTVAQIPKPGMAFQIVERTVIPDTPVRVEYALSTKGRALASTIDAISAWAERWITLQVPSAKSQARRRK